MDDKPKSIWTRDLLDTAFGRFLTGTAFPLALAALAIRAFITQRIRFRMYDYGGFEAICIGVGLLALGACLAMGHHWIPRSLESVKMKNRAVLISLVAVIASLGTALFRVI
ncbi:hypothetical protein [Actomonas aquatica]|uniref:Uncharacterized protein n=1 Tax=Actomonas aquatica TaxID=2866162 RepID=A0ABZ1CC21_9BACT|nr:hypothetical protein [Opitutus sp. WL0086]WRQ89234.1 hypothetical protein K1X11_007425 [Opitutus sp. WL0086]